MHVGPVIAVTDLARARAFYEDALGLEGEETPGGWALHADEGTVAYLLPDVPEAASATWPIASFRVAQLREKVRSLRANGVPFLNNDDLPFDLDEDSISVTGLMQVAWIRDPDGSVLTLFQRTDAQQVAG